jgi:phage tail protein X
LRNYTTIQGDMWDGIAYSECGNASYTDALMNLNRQYREYYLFPAGVTLVLPDPTPETSNSLPPWKRVSGT